MSEAAVPDILLVDEKFHQLNRELKAFHRTGASRIEWEEKRDEMHVHLQEFVDQTIPGTNITNYTVSTMPRGRIISNNRLFAAYRQGKNAYDERGYSRFEAGKAIKSRLVCYHCVITWMKNSKTISDDDWNNRTRRKFLHVFGKSGDSNSSELGLDKRLYAKHSAREFDINGGSRCEGSSTTKWPGESAIAIRQQGNNIISHYRIFVRNVPDDRFYSPILDELTNIDDYCTGNVAHTEKLLNYQGFVDTKSIGSENSLKLLDECLQYNSFKHKDSNVVILEGLASQNNPKELIYFPIKFSGSHVFSFTNSIIPHSDGLGLFLFVKSNISHQDDDYFDYKDASALSEAIASALQWDKPGKLYQFNENSFHTIEHDGVTTSAIDLNNWLYNSPVLKEIRKTSPDLELPTIRTTLRTITIYSVSEKEGGGYDVRPLKNHSRVEAAPIYLFRLSGFILSSTTGQVKFLSVGDAGQPKFIHDLDEDDFSQGFVIVELPEDLEYSTHMELNLSASDEKFSHDTSVRLAKNSDRVGHHSGHNNIQIVEDSTLTWEILNSHLKQVLSTNFSISEEDVLERFFIGKRPIYCEIIKQELASAHGAFQIPSRLSRLEKNLLGLDMLSFGRENLAENSFGVRLRSMGSYRPVGDREWETDGEHIVQLDDQWCMLLTNKPLKSYGLSINDQRLVVTNHGTFFSSEHIIDELSNVPVESKPRFLYHLASDPKSHLQFLIDVMDIIPDTSHLQNLQRYIRNLSPTKEGRLLGCPLSSTLGQKHWTPFSNELQNPVEAKRSEFFLTHQLESEPLTCLDVVYAQNPNATEAELVLRRHHQSGKVDCLTLGRLISDGRRMVDYRPEWWASLVKLESENSILRNLSIALGTQYKTPSSVRSHDWHFLVRDTLRAFHVVSGQIPEAATNTLQKLRSHYSYRWPDPLRKFLLGGGKYVGAPEYRNDDALGGLIDELENIQNSELNVAVIHAILRWTWLQK